MAEILLLPTQPRGWDQARRICADLAAAHEGGTDLGPRAPHIRAGGERLHELSRALERAIEDLNITQPESDLKDPDMREALRSLISAVQTLADAAQRFPATL